MYETIQIWSTVTFLCREWAELNQVCLNLCQKCLFFFCCFLPKCASLTQFLCLFCFCKTVIFNLFLFEHEAPVHFFMLSMTDKTKFLHYCLNVMTVFQYFYLLCNPAFIVIIALETASAPEDVAVLWQRLQPSSNCCGVAACCIVGWDG